jgi:Histone methylation protein DOT1
MARKHTRRLLQVFMNRGMWGFCALAGQKVAQRLRLIKVDKEKVALSKGRGGPETHPFDKEHGTDTSGLISGELLTSGHKNDTWSTAYYGISPSLLTRVIEALEIDPQRFTFVDLGSGKGRALLVASRFPFRKILGVEFIPELSSAASRNVSKFSPPWRECREIETINGDATEFEYPAGPLVIYLFNPFLPPVLKRCLSHLETSLAREPREVFLVYVNPAFQKLVKKYAPKFEQQWEKVFAFTPEEAEADKFGASEERVIVWKYGAKGDIAEA